MRDEQKKSPPPTGDGADRAVALFESILPTLPQELIALYERGALVVGEIGLRHPAVQTRIVEPGQYCIEFTSGMMLYSDLLARYCAGLFVEGAHGATPASIDDVKTYVAEATATYVAQTHALFTFWQKAFAVRDVAVSAETAQLRDDLLACARLFLIAHEIGHVALEEGVRSKATENEEVSADALGLDFGLPPTSHRYPLRLALAGAAFAIRLFVSLERFGLQLSLAYPEQTVRLQLLEDHARAILLTQQRADERMTFAVAILDMFDHLDEKIARTEPTPSYTVPRARVGMLARLLEVAHNRVPVAEFVADLALYERALSPQDFASAYGALCDYYWESTALYGVFVRQDALDAWTTLQKEEYVAMGFAVRAATAVLPSEIKNSLPEKYRVAERDARPESPPT